MVALKGKPDIGDQINKKIIAPLAKSNQQLSQADFPDFNEPTKLGDGKEKVDRLTNLIAIFESPALDFSQTARMATTFWVTHTNISCVTSPLKVAKARASSTRLLRSAVSWHRSSASDTPKPARIPPSTIRPVAQDRCS